MLSLGPSAVYPINMLRTVPVSLTYDIMFFHYFILHTTFLIIPSEKYKL
jgi:hypothetical protein